MSSRDRIRRLEGRREAQVRDVSEMTNDELFRLLDPKAIEVLGHPISTLPDEERWVVMHRVFAESNSAPSIEGSPNGV